MSCVSRCRFRVEGTLKRLNLNNGGGGVEGFRGLGV